MSKQIDAEVERLRWIGVNVEIWPTERVRACCRAATISTRCIFPRAFHIHPLNYALGHRRRRGKIRRPHLRGHGRCTDRCRRHAQTHPHAGRARARFSRGARGQRGARAADAAARLDALADHDVRAGDRADRAIGEIVRYRGAVTDSNRADNHYRIVGGAHTGGERLEWAGRMRAGRPIRAGSSAVCSPTSSAIFPHLGEGRDRPSMVRHPRTLGPSHAASWRHQARSVGGERLRRPWAQHHGDGRRADRPRHRRGRHYLAAVCALRAGLGGRPARARGGAGGLLGLAADRPDRAGACPQSRTGARGARPNGWRGRPQRPPERPQSEARRGQPSFGEAAAGRRGPRALRHKDEPAAASPPHYGYADLRGYRLAYLLPGKAYATYAPCVAFLSFLVFLRGRACRFRLCRQHGRRPFGRRRPRPKVVVVADFIAASEVTATDNGFNTRLERRVGSYPTWSGGSARSPASMTKSSQRSSPMLRAAGIEAQPGGEDLARLRRQCGAGQRAAAPHPEQQARRANRFRPRARRHRRRDDAHAVMPAAARRRC